jgi:hypothetical protein
MLLVIQIVFAGSLSFLTAHLFLLPAILVSAGLEAIVLSLVMLALSSISKSARFVGIMYAGMIFFTHALYGVVFVVTRNTRFSWMSLQANLQHIGDVIFRVSPRYDTPGWVTVLALAAVVATAGFVLERRVRGVEVVT